IRAAAQCLAYFFSTSAGSEYDKVFLELSENGLSLTVDTGSSVVTTTIRTGDVTTGEAVAIPVPSKVFLDVSKALKGENTTLSYSEDAGVLKVETEQAEWDIPFSLATRTQVQDDFSTGFSVPSADLESCLKSLRPYVGSDTG